MIGIITELIGIGLNKLFNSIVFGFSIFIISHSLGTGILFSFLGFLFFLFIPERKTHLIISAINGVILISVASIFPDMIVIPIVMVMVVILFLTSIPSIMELMNDGISNE